MFMTFLKLEAQPTMDLGLRSLLFSELFIFYVIIKMNALMRLNE